MSTARRQFQMATIAAFEVASGQSVTVNELVVFGSADNTVQDAGADSDLGIGIAKESGSAGAIVEVFMLGPIVPVVVAAAGTATRGTKAISSTGGGFTNAPAHVSGGATENNVYGIFAESGTAADVVGMMLAVGNRGSA